MTSYAAPELLDGGPVDERADDAVRRELRALQKIRHPNVVEVFWASKTHAAEWYLITEFIYGEQLDAFIGQGRCLRDREAADVALDLLDALVAFHLDSARLGELDTKRRQGELSEAEFGEWMDLSEHGLVQRDIKPRNVILTRTGAKLLDFNIASRVGDPVRTQSGTPPYQPPTPTSLAGRSPPTCSQSAWFSTSSSEMATCTRASACRAVKGIAGCGGVR